MSEEPIWPEHFGPCCPPDDASDLDGELFYLAHVPVEPEDFLSAKEMGFFKNADPCERAALSCWSTAEIPSDLHNLPRHKAKRVLKATFASADGKFKPTGSNAARGHRSAWFRSSVHRQLPRKFVP